MIKKILVPTDFSETADNALMYACSMAITLNAEIEIVHVFMVPLLTARGIPILPENDVLQSDLKYATEKLEKLKASVSEHHNLKLHINAVLIHWQIEFTEAVHNQNADLIIIGNTGATGLKKIFMGSNAARIIRDAPVPVIAVPRNASFKHLKKAGFAYDGLPLNNLSKFRILKLLKSIPGVTIQAFQIITGKSPSVLFPPELTEFVSTPEYIEIHDDDVYNGILTAVELNQYDMVILLPRKKGFFRNLIYGSITDRVGYELCVPLLAIRE
ncbi:MAG: universal stress protein [Bacteroidota bacterium]|jgi:nucleotide-binding universal stress UspA family protein|nr:universal stress protein [Bacteroidota bacterium]